MSPGTACSGRFCTGCSKRGRPAWFPASQPLRSWWPSSPRAIASGSTLIAACSSTQLFSHLPQPVQASACTVGSSIAWRSLRGLLTFSSVIALSITGQTR